MTRANRIFLLNSFACTGAIVAALSQFFNWTQAILAPRTSFSLLRTADRLHFIEGGTATFLYRLWFLIPFVAAVSLCALASGLHKTAVTLCAVVGIVVGGTAGLLIYSSLPALAGAKLGLLGGSVAVISSCGYLVVTFTGSRNSSKMTNVPRGNT